MSHLIYDRLFELDPDLRPVPRLAVGMPAYENDGYRWVVEIRGDVQFHDGTPLTANDVAFSFALRRDRFDDPDVRASSATTIEFAWDEPEGTREPAPNAHYLAERLAEVPIMSERAVRSALANLETTARQIDAAELAQLIDEGSPDRQFPACPDACAEFIERSADLLRRAGAVVPARASFDHGGSDGEAAYGVALAERLARVEALIGVPAGPEPSVEVIASALPVLSLAAEPIGSGPFRFDASVPGERVELAAFDEYFAGRPQTPRVVLLPNVLPDRSLFMLPSGDADVILDAPIRPPHVQARYGTPAQFAWTAIVFSLLEGRLFAERELRQAFAMCLDREAIVSELSRVPLAAVDSYVHPSSWADDRAAVPVRDVAGARVLLEGAGWTLDDDGIYARDGVRLAATARPRAQSGVESALRITTAHLVSEHVRECGIQLDVIEPTDQTMIDPSRNPLGSNHVSDVGVFTFPSSRDPDGYPFFASASYYSDDFGVFGLNFGVWMDERTDELVLAGRTEHDPGRRRAIFTELQKHLRDERPVIPLFARLHTVALAESVRSTTGEIDLDSPRFFWDIEDWVVE